MSAQESSSTTIRHAEKRRNSTCALADAIAKAALDAWRSLDVRTSRQTVVAAIVLQHQNGCTCLSLGAGTKTPSRAAVVAGGAGLAALSLGLSAFRSTGRLAVSTIRRRATTTLEVTSRDAAYPWVLHWLKRTNPIGSFRHASVKTLHTDDGPTFDLVPAPGLHVVRLSLIHI